MTVLFRTGTLMTVSRQAGPRQQTSAAHLGRRALLGHGSTARGARGVRDALNPGDASDVDDIRLPFALDDVDAVEVDPERPASPQGDLAQFLRQRERFPVFLVLGPRGKDLFDAEEPAADRVDLPVAALKPVVAPGDDGLLAGRHVAELGDAPDNATTKPTAVLTRLDDERSRIAGTHPLRSVGETASRAAISRLRRS